MNATTNAAAQTIWQRTAATHERARQDVSEKLQAMLDNPSPQNSFALEAATEYLLDHPRFPSGVDVILAKECPIGAVAPIACFVCTWGHMTECHAPRSCVEARCGHLREDDGE